MARLWWYLDPSSPHQLKKNMLSKLDPLWQNCLDPGMIGTDPVISETCYKGTILQRNIKWSFSYNSFVKFHGKKVWAPQPVYYIQICVVTRCVKTGLHSIWLKAGSLFLCPQNCTLDGKTCRKSLTFFHFSKEKELNEIKDMVINTNILAVFRHLKEKTK